MQTAVLLPIARPRFAAFIRGRDLLLQRYGDLKGMMFFSPPEDIEWYQEILGAEVAVSPVKEGCLASYPVIIAVVRYVGGAQEYPIPLGMSDEARVLGLSLDPSLNLSSFQGRKICIDEIEYPHGDTHIFNRLSMHGDRPTDIRGYYYFPYGYLYRHIGVGPVNEFGHRITHSLDTMSSRQSTEKVIAVFGGSSTFSIYCPHHQMFPSVIERILNERLAQEKRPEHVTVLNFGQPSHVILNQIFTWVLFGHRVRPDVVISHDGVNDLMWGQLVDSYLVGRSQIVYHDNFEEWAQILHGTQDRARTQLVDEEHPRMKVINPSKVVIDTYLARKAQFCEMVHGAGAHFFWGLQPISASKGGLNEEEQEGITNWVRSSPYAPATNNLPHLFTTISTRYTIPPPAIDVNFHLRFKEFTEDDTLILDHCHLTPQGDEIVASVYAEMIYKRLFG